MTDVQPDEAYRISIEFLYRLRWFGAKLGLENTVKLAELAGNSQRGLQFIHVAGTNGKGSTCAMLESIYRAGGRRVGLFTSPHLVSFRERIQVNRQWISEERVVQLVNAMRPWLSQFPEQQHPTFFETITVMALRYFAEEKCDLVIWEAGLGGRLDATNIVTPVASVITNIEYDHQQWLGDTLAQIAAEKAGIIKPGVPVITASEQPEAIEVIKQTARDLGSPLTRITVSDASRLGRQPPLPGLHQRLNTALALATVDVLQSCLPVSTEAIDAGLATVSWPGRSQWITRSWGQKILLDGAHNPAAAQTLVETLRDPAGASRLTLILGVLQDKDWRAMCRILAPLAQKILLVPVLSERTAAAQQLSDACKEFNDHADVIAPASLSEALADAAADPLVVVTGSLYLIGEAMELLGVSPAAARDERGLNEWTGVPNRETAKEP